MLTNVSAYEKQTCNKFLVLFHISYNVMRVTYQLG